jgi:hypothetical protein
MRFNTRLPDGGNHAGGPGDTEAVYRTVSGADHPSRAGRLTY